MVQPVSCPLPLQCVVVLSSLLCGPYLEAFILHFGILHKAQIISLLNLLLATKL